MAKKTTAEAEQNALRRPEEQVVTLRKREAQDICRVLDYVVRESNNGEMATAVQLMLENLRAKLEGATLVPAEQLGTPQVPVEWTVVWHYVANYAIHGGVRALSAEAAISHVTRFFGPEFRAKAKVYAFRGDPVLAIEKGLVCQTRPIKDEG